MELSPASLLKNYQSVSSLSMIYDRLNEAINNPYSSMSDIGKIIQEDVGLTARLLRLVNSAFFGFPKKIETITQALVIVGVQQIRDLALATSVVNVFEGVPEDTLSMESFWQHSIACGVAAKILATFRRDTSVERYFVAGMLHDVGRLVIHVQVPDIALKARDASETYGWPLLAAEREIMGFDHAEVGGELLKLWNLPLSLVEVVANHHSPSGAKQYQVEAAVVHVADIVVHAMEYGFSGEGFVPPHSPRAWESVGLKTSILSPALDQLDRQVAEVIKTIL